MDNKQVEVYLEKQLEKIGMPLGERITKQTIIEFGEIEDAMNPQPQNVLELIKAFKTRFYENPANHIKYLQELYLDFRRGNDFNHPFIRHSRIKNGFGLEYMPDFSEGDFIVVNFNIEYSGKEIDSLDFYLAENANGVLDAELHPNNKSRIVLLDEPDFHVLENPKEFSAYFKYCSYEDKKRYHEFCKKVQERQDLCISHQECLDEIVNLLETRMNQQFVNVEKDSEDERLKKQFLSGIIDKARDEHLL